MPRRPEFVALSALLMSSVALSVDIMLPALGEIARDFSLRDDNDRQFIIVALFLGLTFGQLLFGPLSDTLGRRPMILAGLGFFIAGAVVSAVAPSFEVMIAGRLMQGFGAAGPRIVTVAMIRDRFEGRPMAEILSLVMGIFIFVPIVAPSLGQALLFLIPWRVLFLVLAIIGMVAASWLLLRQPETLAHPTPLSLQAYLGSTKAVILSPVAMAYTVAGACCYGALLGYVNSAQQLFQDVYRLGDAFALWFGVSAAFVSLATFVNSRLVQRYAMEKICIAAIAVLLVWSLGFDWLFRSRGSLPGLWSWMLFNGVALFLLGLTFGNVNAIALRQFGQMAGVASALVASLNAAISLVIAWRIGSAFDGTVSAMMLGYLSCSAAALLLMLCADRFGALAWQKR